VQQFLQENYLRWDSLGEFLAIAVSIEDLGHKTKNAKALVMAKAMDDANGKVLEYDRSPQRKVGEIDNRGSHFYLAMYWARALASQTADRQLQETFEPIAKEFEQNEAAIISELNSVQGKPAAIGGYYQPDATLTGRAMRPSTTFNRVVDAMAATSTAR
jgi:isocitrate dehydrogenase